jgi:molybdate transport system substrate-binding protein
MVFWNRCFAGVAGIAMLLEIAPAQAAELTVFSDGPLQTSLVNIATIFKSDTKHEVHVIYGTAPALRAKLQAGERADVLISLAAEIEEMARLNKFLATQLSVASIKLGLAVRKGASVPNIQTVDALKRTLLDADSIIHNNLASGLLFAKQLDRIGIAEQLKSKIVVINGNTQLVELTKRKRNDVGAGQLTQLIASKDVQLVGALPSEAQAETVYSAGALSDSRSPDAAKALVQFLASPAAAAEFAAVGAR